MQGGTFKMPGQDGQANYQEGMRLYGEGRQSEAMPLLMAGLASMESIWGHQDRIEMVDCLQALGDCYENALMLNEALALRIRLYELGVKVLGPEHFDVIAIMLKICMLQEHLGYINDAMATIDDAVVRAKHAVTREDPLAQRLIEQYNRLQHLNLTQQSQQVPPDTEAALQTPPLVDGPASMQDYARQMLADMPGFQDNPNSQSPAVKQGYNNYLNTSMSSMAAMDRAQADDLRQAPSLDPSKTPGSLPTPPDADEIGQRQPQTRDSGALSYRPQANDQDENLSEESYSIDQIRQIRDRNKLGGDFAHSQTSDSQGKARRLSPDDQRSIQLGRILKDFTLPVLGVSVVLALVGYLIFSNPASDLAQDEKEKAIQTALQSALAEDIFLTADGQAAIRFQGPAEAVYSPGPGSATKVGFRRLNPAWGDIFGAALSSIWEKQIWFDDNQSVLTSEDEVRYYRATGQEFQTIEKMKQLAGVAQGFYLRGGQYPDVVPPTLINYFSYLNPYTGNVDQFQIRQIPHVDALGLKAKENLESGRLLGGDDKGAPGKIVCYAVIEGEIKRPDPIMHIPNPDANVSKDPQNKCVAFLIRGYDSHGQLIQASRPGLTLVVDANPEYLDAGATPADSNRPISQNKTKKITTVTTKIKIKNQIKPKALTPNAVQFKPVVVSRDPQTNTPAINAIKARPVVPAAKNTSLLLIKHPPLPLKILHYLLSINLFLCTALAIARSRMRAVDYQGNEIQEDSNIALIIGIIFAIMLGISLLMQFVIYA